jgi:hypothetical protein
MKRREPGEMGYFWDGISSAGWGECGGDVVRKEY